LKLWKKIFLDTSHKGHTSPQWLPQTISMNFTASPLGLLNSSETKTTLYTYVLVFTKSSVGFFSQNSSVFFGRDTIACYSSFKVLSRVENDDEME